MIVIEIFRDYGQILMTYYVRNANTLVNCAIVPPIALCVGMDLKIDSMLLIVDAKVGSMIMELMNVYPVYCPV